MFLATHVSVGYISLLVEKGPQVLLQLRHVNSKSVCSVTSVKTERKTNAVQWVLPDTPRNRLISLSPTRSLGQSNHPFNQKNVQGLVWHRPPWYHEAIGSLENQAISLISISWCIQSLDPTRRRYGNSEWRNSLIQLNGVLICFSQGSRI